MVIFLFILIIIVILLPFPEPVRGASDVSRNPNYLTIAREVLKTINKNDMKRAIKYLEIRSNLKNATPTQMIIKMAKAKKIKSADEFNIRYEMGNFSFMSQKNQIKFLNKLSNYEPGDISRRDSEEAYEILNYDV